MTTPRPPIYDFRPFDPTRVIAVRAARETLWLDPPPPTHKPRGRRETTTVTLSALPPSLAALSSTDRELLARALRNLKL